jgi:hypothetical protein
VARRHLALTESKVNKARADPVPYFFTRPDLGLSDIPVSKYRHITCKGYRSSFPRSLSGIHYSLKTIGSDSRLRGNDSKDEKHFSKKYETMYITAFPYVQL